MIRVVLLAIVVLVNVNHLAVGAEPEPVATILAERGKLLLDNNDTTKRGSKSVKSTAGKSTPAKLGKWTKNPDSGALRSNWKPSMGHTPVVNYNVRAKNLIVEVTFRYGVKTEQWHDHCFRITLDNRERLTGHILSAWANPDNDFIETGFLLQHIHKTPAKKIVKDLLLDRQPLQFEAQKWETAVLEVVDDEALFRMGDHLAYAKFDELVGEKSKVALTVGKTWHEVKRVRVWEASRNAQWSENREEVLSKRDEFSPMPHQYRPTPRTK